MPTLLNCKFCLPESDHFSILKSYLPADYEYIVCNLSINNTNNANFKTRLRTSGRNQDNAQKWLEDFQMQSKCTMRVERTFPRSGTKNVYKVDFRCQHNTRPRTEKKKEKDICKNTDCPAKMCITVKRVITERKSRSKDPHLPDYPTVIQIDFQHNHPIHTPEILKYRSVLPEVKDKIIALYKLGHNPSTALDMHKYDLLLEHGENFEKICHDRALLPDFRFCYRLYYKIMKRKQAFSENCENVKNELPTLISCSQKKTLSLLSNCENSNALISYQEEIVSISSSNINFEKKNKKRKLENTVVDKTEMSVQLEEILCKFCESGGFAGMQIVDNNTVMALCTPFMHRVHTLIKHSGEIVFVDTYGEMDEPNSCRVYMFLTYSAIGAVPLGCLVTTSTTANCVKGMLDLWKQILPNNSFFNKTEGPDLFFTNDNEFAKQTIKQAFPKSQVLISMSHILQASWTFLLDRKNTIKKEHRSVFFSKIKMLLFSQSVEELEMNYAYALADNLIKSNMIFVDYITHLYNHRHDWSLVYRRHSIPRAHDFTVFFWESAMILLKDPILCRTRTFNQLQIIDFLSRMDTFYEKKILDLVNSRFDSIRLSRFLFIELSREAYTITQNSEIEYEVYNDSKDTTYQVDISLGVCECRTGKTGAPCKHQLLVYRNFSIPVYDCIPPNTEHDKNLLLHLATGQKIESDLTTLITKSVNSTMQEPCTGEIAMQDLDPCNESDFFLNDTTDCDNISQNAAINNTTLSQHVTALSLPATELMHTVAANHVLVQTSPNSLNVSDTILSHNLLSHLEQTAPQDISLNNEINPPLDQHIPTVNIEPTSLVQTSTVPSSPCENVTESVPQEVCDIIDQICTELKQRSAKSPNSLKPALTTFFKNLRNLSSDSSLEFALYSFGKFSKYATPLFKRKIVGNKLVGLQSTSEIKKRLSLKSSKVTKK